MPKKTKKEKILAEYRKRLRIIEQQLQTNNTQLKLITKEEKTENKKNLATQKIIFPNKHQSKIEEDKLINKYFFNDLKKSLLLSFFLIALEFFLYFAKLIK